MKFLKKISKKRNMVLKERNGATTNDKGWSMQDVWNWGRDAHDFVESRQSKQKIKYGDTTVMLSKKEPISLVFASEIM